MTNYAIVAYQVHVHVLLLTWDRGTSFDGWMEALQGKCNRPTIEHK
jgi:hypothetical protein